MQQELLERIAATIRDRGEPLAIEEIATEFLKLTVAGPAASKLVRAMLARDVRFAELADGSWSLKPPKAELCGPVVVCLIDAPAGTSSAPWLWRISVGAWGEDRGPLQHTGPERSDALATILRWMAEHPVATERPGLLRRWTGAQERIHAVPEVEPIVIDLRAWARLLGDAGATAVAGGALPDETDDPLDPRLEALALRTEQVVEAAHARGLSTWQQVARAPQRERDAARDTVWSEQWAFTPADLAALPEEPGVYRFLDRDARLLYVGKAKNLRRRIASYFRPLDDASSRRAAFLKTLHRLEYETTGTELEALILEAMQIRLHEPTWNVQVKLGEHPRESRRSEEDLVLLLPRGDESCSLLALGGERVARMHLEPDHDPAALRTALRDFYVEGSAGDPLEEIPAPERALARRWLGWSGTECVSLRLADFATFAGLVDAIEKLTAEHNGGARAFRPLVVRDGPTGGPGL